MAAIVTGLVWGFEALASANEKAPHTRCGAFGAVKAAEGLKGSESYPVLNGCKQSRRAR